MVWASYNLLATVSLLTILCLTDGQAWNVQDSLEGFKEYFETSKKLVHQMASHAQDGFELLSKFEQFMSHSLDEDCLYECPKLGQVTVPNPNHRPSR